MKKLMFGLMCLTLILSLSCEIPRSVTVKGSPGLFVPLGSPFKEGEGLADYISSEKIREMMDEGSSSTDAGRELKIYEYRGAAGSDTLTYAVHYPIVEYPFDIGQGVNDAMNSDVSISFSIPDDITALAGPLFNTLYENGCYLTQEELGTAHDDSAPLFSIPFSDMSKLVVEITGTAFGMQLDWNQAFEDYLRVYIPAFGIGTPDAYAAGTKSGDKLRFVGNKTTFRPATDLTNDRLNIYVKILQPAGGTISLEEVFDWETATVDTAGAGDGLQGEYTIENALGDFLGTGVQFKSVQGYIYVNGLEDTATTIDLYAGTSPLLRADQLTSEDLPVFPADTAQPFTASLLPHSLTTLTDDNIIDLNTILNSGSSTTLSYRINIEQMTITNDQAMNSTKKITADMVILVPLELAIDTPASDTRFNQYVKLDLGEDAFSMGSGDLFSRKGNNDDDLFSMLKQVTVSLKPLKGNKTVAESITAVDVKNLAVLLKLNNDSYKFITFDEDFSPPAGLTNEDWGYLELSLDQRDVAYPFSPEFEILLKRDDGDPNKSATFKVKQQEEGKMPLFDFNLTVEAQTDINETIDF